MVSECLGIPLTILRLTLVGAWLPGRLIVDTCEFGDPNRLAVGREVVLDILLGSGDVGLVDVDGGNIPRGGYGRVEAKR